MNANETSQTPKELTLEEETKIATERLRQESKERMKERWGNNNKSKTTKDFWGYANADECVICGSKENLRNTSSATYCLVHYRQATRPTSEADIARSKEIGQRVVDRSEAFEDYAE